MTEEEEEFAALNAVIEAAVALEQAQGTLPTEEHADGFRLGFGCALAQVGAGLISVRPEPKP